MAHDPPLQGEPPASDPLERLSGQYGLTGPPVESLRALWTRLSSDPTAPTAIRGSEEVLDRHIADSLVGLEIAPLREATTIVDLGSGAGVPALVLAAALPDAKVTALEAQQSKCAFIASLAATAKLDNVEVVRARAEDWVDGLGSHDVAVARALSSQPVVLEYAAPLLVSGGHLVEWRGRRDEEEEARGRRAAEELGLELVAVVQVTPFPSAASRHLHVFVKVRATPERFPRRAGVASRRPLG